MSGVERSAQVHARQHGEDVGLQERYQHFERSHSDRHQQRQWREDGIGSPGAKEHHYKSAENFQRDVSRQYVGEETHGMADRLRKERDDLNHHYKREDNDRYTLGNKGLKKSQTVFGETDHEYSKEYEQRHRGCHDDVARDGEKSGDHS